MKYGSEGQGSHEAVREIHARASKWVIEEVERLTKVLERMFEETNQKEKEND